MDIYNRLIKFLSSFVDVFEDLSVYDVPPMPKDGRITKADEPVTDNGNIMTDRFGRWKVNETVDTTATFDYDRVKGRNDAKGRTSVLQGWDTSFLLQEFDGKFDNNFAAIMKLEWSTPNENGDYPSNQDIVDRHTHDGITGDGFSLRNVKRYTGCFNAAERMYEQEAEQQKQKNTPLPQ